MTKDVEQIMESAIINETDGGYFIGGISDLDNGPVIIAKTEELCREGVSDALEGWKIVDGKPLPPLGYKLKSIIWQKYPERIIENHFSNRTKLIEISLDLLTDLGEEKAADILISVIPVDAKISTIVQGITNGQYNSGKAIAVESEEYEISDGILPYADLVSDGEDFKIVDRKQITFD